MAGLSARIRHALQGIGVYQFNPETVAAVHYSVIFRQREFGKKSMCELRAWLGQHGLDLVDAPPQKTPLQSPSSDELEAVNFLKSRGYHVHRVRNSADHPHDRGFSVVKLVDTDTLTETVQITPIDLSKPTRIKGTISR